MSGIAAAVRAGAWLALGGLVLGYIFLAFNPHPDPQELGLWAPEPPASPSLRPPALDAGAVVAAEVILAPTGRSDVAGRVAIRYDAGRWRWGDGSPIASSTPEDVVERFAALNVSAFVTEDAVDRGWYGLNDPVARVALVDREGRELVARLGARSRSASDSNSRFWPLRYAMIEGETAVYLVDDGDLFALQDLVRESSRREGGEP